VGDFLAELARTGKMDQRPMRIVIVSDQPIFLRGLESILGQMKEVQLVGEARCSAEAVELCQMTGPDALLMDLKNLQEEGGPVIRQIAQQWPRIKVILLEEKPAGFEGVQPYSFSRDLNEDEFEAALEQVREGSDQAVFKSEADESLLCGAREYQPVAYRSANEEMMSRELVMAGKIQADILPEEAPQIRGLDIAAPLDPAHETSGDFYDFIPMSGTPLGPRKWGLVVADVSDKGMGAALLMALTSTLFRTYAIRFPTLPAVTLSTISERILSDTRGGMFVTAFLGIIEPHTGRLVYANGGHPPGYVISLRRGKDSIERLRPTGMALGVDEQARWRQKEVRLGPGDLLVLYTDGITEAQNPQGAFFGEDRLLEVVLSKAGSSAEEIRDALLEEARRFVGGSAQQDDVALIVIRREE
jgi:serine phosphatase RsbU (regulator of sigma subunit)